MNLSMGYVYLEFILLAVVCCTVLGDPQATTTNSDTSSSSDISNDDSVKVAGLLTNIYDILGEKAKGLSKCQFPFIYKGTTYTKCTADYDHYGMFWCSTKTNENNEHVYETWRHCKLSDGVPLGDFSFAADGSLGEGDCKSSGSQNEWTAQQLVMRVADGNLIRGFFISEDEKKMMQKRYIALEVTNEIALTGSTSTEKYFSKDFENESTAVNFLRTIDNFGVQIAVDGTADYLFVSAKFGTQVDYENHNTKETNTTASSDFFLSLSCYNIPTKSVDLDPRYMRLNQEVLDRLVFIEKTIAEKNSANEALTLFNDLFEYYGTHFLTGSMEFGGTMIVKSKTNISVKKESEKIKTAVKESAKAYLDINAFFEDGIGGVSVSANAKSIKDRLSVQLSSDTLKSITVILEKKGGPPGVVNVTKWKEGLVGQDETWRIINKSFKLIAMWDLILMHHDQGSQFLNVTKFASQMKEAWETIIKPAVPPMSKLIMQFRDLGISAASESKRKELLVEMLNHGKLGAEKKSKYAALSITEGGRVVMSALQEEQSVPYTNLLPFESVELLAETPYKVYLTLEYNDLYLGDIIIVLNGSNPSRVKQMLELSTGDNSVNGTWRRSTMSFVGFGQPGAFTSTPTYQNATGSYSKSLFPVEASIKHTPAVLGEVRGWIGQAAGFIIRIKKPSDKEEVEFPIIGHVISGLEIIEQVSSHDLGDPITISDCGLVVIDNDQEDTDCNRCTK